MSTAILQLSEDGDLQRIHDKWLMQSTCTLESAEIESDRLHLTSFWGLYLVCGITCFIALLIYFCQIVHQLYHRSSTDSVSPGSTASQSGGLRRFLSLIDEKTNQSNTANKRRKVGRSLSDNEAEIEWGKGPRST